MSTLGRPSEDDYFPWKSPILPSAVLSPANSLQFITQINECTCVEKSLPHKCFCFDFSTWTAGSQNIQKGGHRIEAI
jgi:hypothetical protein